MLGKIDVEANVTGKIGAYSAKAGAVRWGISMGLRSFVDAETVDKMRLGELHRNFLNLSLILFSLLNSWPSTKGLSNTRKEEAWTGRSSQKVHLEETINDPSLVLKQK